MWEKQPKPPKFGTNVAGTVLTIFRGPLVLLSSQTQSCSQRVWMVLQHMSLYWLYPNLLNVWMLYNPQSNAFQKRLNCMTYAVSRKSSMMTVFWNRQDFQDYACTVFTCRVVHYPVTTSVYIWFSSLDLCNIVRVNWWKKPSILQMAKCCK